MDLQGCISVWVKKDSVISKDHSPIFCSAFSTDTTFAVFNKMRCARHEGLTVHSPLGLVDLAHASRNIVVLGDIPDENALLKATVAFVLGAAFSEQDPLCYFLLEITFPDDVLRAPEELPKLLRTLVFTVGKLAHSPKKESLERSVCFLEPLEH